MGPACALAIASYDNTPSSGFYLFYLGDDGTVITDTHHESIDAALDQAAHEYVGLTWTDVGR